MGKNLLSFLTLKAGSRWSGRGGVNDRSKHNQGTSHRDVNKFKYQRTKRINVHEVMKSTIPPTLCSIRHTWLPFQVNQLNVKDLQLDCPPVSRCHPAHFRVDVPLNHLQTKAPHSLNRGCLVTSALTLPSGQYQWRTAVVNPPTGVQGARPIHRSCCYQEAGWPK